LQYFVLPILFLCLLACQSNTSDDLKTKTEPAKSLKPAETNKSSKIKEPEVKTIFFVCTWGFDKSIIAATYFNELLKDKRFPYKATNRALKMDKRNMNNNIPTNVLIDILSTGLTLQSTDVMLLSEADINSAYKIIYLDDPSEAKTSSKTPPKTPKTPQSENSEMIFWDNIPPLKAGVDKTTAIIKEKVDKFVKEIGC